MSNIKTRVSDAIVGVHRCHDVSLQQRLHRFVGRGTQHYSRGRRRLAALTTLMVAVAFVPVVDLACGALRCGWPSLTDLTDLIIGTDADVLPDAFLGGVLKWPRPQKTADIEPPYKVLLESTLPDLDLGEVAQEMLADEWAEQENFMVKVLNANGARAMTVEPWVGKARNMTFKMRLGIPLGKILLYLRLASSDNATEVDASASSEGVGDGLTRVTSTHEVTVGKDKSLQVASRYLCYVPLLEVIEMRLVMTLRHGKPSAPCDADSCVRLSFGSFVDSGMESGFIANLMEKGFMQAAKSYGQALTAELHRRMLLRPKR